MIDRDVQELSGLTHFLFVAIQIKILALAVDASFGAYLK
jgi:hypothetical protein